jgi:hypothetical protein
MEFNSLFEYKNGELYWKIARSNFIKIGQKAGCLQKNGYVYVNIDCKPKLAHRIIFMMQKGYLPTFLDHIDGNRSNNKIENLRPATNSQNKWNAKIRNDNSSGIKGITWEKKRNKWRASCNKNGKRHDAGFFDSLEDAKKAIQILRSSIHGNFAKH